MKNKIKIVYLLLLVSIVFLSSPCVFASDDNELTNLDQSSDNEFNTVDVSGNFTNINNSINGETSLSLTDNVTLTDEESDIFAKGINITSTVVIDGNGHTIKATSPNGNSARIFNVLSSGDLTLKNIILSDAYVRDKGGAVNVNGKINLLNCTFINTSSTTSSGGAIYLNGNSNVGNNNIINCTFINTTSNWAGGAIYFNKIHNSHVINCTFINTNSANNGGAVYLSKSDNIVLSNCTFINNNATYGGAIYISIYYDDNVENNTNITYCVFLNNTATIGKVIFEWAYNSVIPNFHNFNYNWWGNNTPVTNNNWISLISILDDTTYIQYSPDNFVIMTFTPSSATINKGSTQKLSASLNTLNDTTVLSENLPVREVFFTGSGVSPVNGNLSDGSFDTTFTGSNAGTYTVSAIIDNQELNSTITVNNPVPPVPTTISTNTNLSVSPSSAYIEDKVNLIANITARDGAILNNGHVNFYINNTLINSVNVVNGSASTIYIINKGSGNYTVRGVYSGYDKYETSQNTENLLVMLTPTSINGEVSLISDSEANVTITLTPTNVSGDVEVIVNNKTYTTVVVNGSGYVIINYTNGTNYLSLNYVGNEYYGPSRFNTTFESIINTVINADNINMSYRDGTSFVLTLMTSNDHCLNNQLVFITINNKTYNRTTNSLGNAKIDINLYPGTYSVSVEYKGTSYYTPSYFNGTIIVNYYAPKLDTDNLVMYYKDGSKFTARVFNNLGELARNENVTFIINNVIYNRFTDKFGEAKLNINLRSNEYNITTSWKGLINHNTVTVKS